MAKKKGRGRPLPDTPAMKAWREEYENMTLEDHLRRLRGLGLDEEDLHAFRLHWQATHKKQKA